MAKAEKMNRGMSSKKKHGGGTEIKLPEGIHSFDHHGNVYASLPELSRIQPKYFTLDQLKSSIEDGTLTALTMDGYNELLATIARVK
ncbi:MAG: hypothetical protein JXR91_04330 [Deltaproteobacteria bacterium]|nr:hypothetical protein [Deltaproteobacteria bacterium]